ncbi:hypothetical protein L21SP5_01664 [Salinivirga cyanobacteriivorans]|uniref:Outer membrane protein beta-barrel domain-containing protein n=1 Tax=Salinivirga cyanobacteriivorans TaxID=1307839 RepID=A0A0S2HZ34_9BACT|nr:hypothetical protein [Salinivirga cyanobacteriivorans]ALO15307.1 hypothetical protein L21SP5_01664 [Salinivirga cyanobacteriivorans]
MKKWILIAILLVMIARLSSQTIKDDRILIPMISAELGYNHPGGDFAERFNGSGQVGAAFNLKFKSNIFLGVQGNYLFSQGIKDPEYRDYLENEDGWITNFYGEPGIVAEKLDGFTVSAHVGYIIPVLNPNPNSGIMVSGGMGFMQHKIWIEERGNNIPQLTDEYIKGYDRLCNGLMTKQFLGYMFFQEKAAWNFYAGFEFTQGYTQNRRSWDFIEKRKIDEKRLDLLYSIKIGWVISLHKRMATEIYYY